MGDILLIAYVALVLAAAVITLLQPPDPGDVSAYFERQALAS
jgi:preprotein translocase subunit SecG